MKYSTGILRGVTTLSLVFIISIISINCINNNYDVENGPYVLTVKKCIDFEPDGSGQNAEWQKADWITLQKLSGGDLKYKSQFKIMYSSSGIYMLVDGDDQKITSDYTEDQSDMYKADVFEVFLHPDTTYPIYFEYEVNALGKELVLLIPNIGGNFMGWEPWHYEGDRVIKRPVTVRGGAAEPGGAISGWTAELFFPYAILKPLVQKAPQSGDVWNGNFYRLDYDAGVQVKWSWAPIERSFHEFEKYGQLVFE